MNFISEEKIMEQIKQRSPYWDNIKGLLMLLTVLAHILYQLQDSYPAANRIVDYIYMFHMPAFVFVSGYFGKSERSAGAPAIIRLIFLYFIFNSATGLILGFDSLLEPLYSYWYLLALVVWRLSARHIAKFRGISIVLFVIAVFAGFFSTIDNTLAAARIIAFYPYYMLGYKLPFEKGDSIIGTKYGKRLIRGAAVLAGAGVLAYFLYGCFNYSDRMLLMYGYEKNFDALGRIALIVIACLAVYALVNICPNKKIPLLSMFGRNSLWIFLLHRPFTIVFSKLLNDRGQGVVVILSVAGAVALCIVLGNGFVAKHLNRFAESGTAIFTGEQTKKFTVAKLAIIVVAAGFIVSVIAEAFFGITLADTVDAVKDKIFG